MTQLIFTWTNGQQRCFDCIGTETLQELLESNGIIIEDSVIRLFYHGKELDLGLTTGVFKADKKYKIYVYQKANQPSTFRPRIHPRNIVTPDQKSKQLMLKESAHITDNFYNRINMLQKTDIQFQKSYQHFLEKQNSEVDSIPTVLNYESKISEAPLPFFFESTRLPSNSTSSEKVDLIDHMVFQKKPNDDASPV